jgi:hypothetical protein
VKASDKKTPQPTPASLSENQTRAAGTSQRVAILRKDCLIRNRHRYVISRKFDINEANRRVRRDSNNAKNNNDCLLQDEVGIFDNLKVAHILSHSLMSVPSEKSELVRPLITLLNSSS